MENARIAIFEDKEPMRKLFKRIVEVDRHQVIAEIASIEQAREFIISPEALSADVALVDGNLLGSDRSGQHGAEISSLIRQNLPGVTIIGISGNSAVEGADVSFIKPHIEGLRAYIAGLPDRQ